jgi:tetratricopeptide (TPR) repeat protein
VIFGAVAFFMWRTAEEQAKIAAAQRAAADAERQGDVDFNLGEFKAALDDFNKTLGILQDLENSDPQNLQWQHDVSIVLEKLGDTFEKSNLPDKAQESFSHSLEIRKHLVNGNADDSGLEQDLSSGFDRLGNISKDQNHQNEALECYRESLNIREKFAKRYPEDATWQTYLAFSYEHIGDSLYEQKQLSEALQEFRKAFTIRKKLADALQKDSERQARVAHLCWRIAQALDRSKSSEKEEAIRLVTQGQEILETQSADLAELQRLATGLTEQETATTQ